MNQAYPTTISCVLSLWFVNFTGFPTFYLPNLRRGNVFSPIFLSVTLSPCLYCITPLFSLTILIPFGCLISWFSPHLCWVVKEKTRCADAFFIIIRKWATCQRSAFTCLLVSVILTLTKYICDHKQQMVQFKPRQHYQVVLLSMRVFITMSTAKFYTAVDLFFLHRENRF